MTIPVLINTRSGGFEGRKLLHAVSAIYSETKQTHLVYDLMTVSEETLHDLCCNASGLIIGGGDGTIHTLLPQLIATNIAIGIIPLGTGNDLAREFSQLKRYRTNGLRALLAHYASTAQCEDAHRSLTVWKARTAHDVILCHFCNYVSFGFDAAVVNRFAQERNLPSLLGNRWRRIQNRIHYSYAGMRELFWRFQNEPKLTHTDGQVIAIEPKACSIFFPNIRSIMGLGRSNSVSDPSDTLLECVVPVTLRDYLGMLPFFTSIARPKEVLKGSAPAWQITFGKGLVPLQADGEGLGAIESVEVIIEPAGKLKLL